MQFCITIEQFLLFFASRKHPKPVSYTHLFTLRGVTPLPFDTLYVGIPDYTQFGADVRRALRAASPNTKLVATPKEAQAILQEVSNTRALREVSLNAQGRVEEYELGINYTFRLIDAKGRALIPDTTLSICLLYTSRCV